jgi:hypothetical protein
MRAATAKALILGTTDEVGEHDGPDFKSGWGLLNAKRAAQVISDNGTTARISELSLKENESYITTIFASGDDPLVLTMAWNDPPGNPPSGTDPKTIMLVNDLDVVISGRGKTYYPWRFTPNDNSNNFTDPADKGDNKRDNVERIDAGIVPPGKYTVTVTHKNSLQENAQEFSMVIYGITETPVEVTGFAEPKPGRPEFTIISGHLNLVGIEFVRAAAIFDITGKIRLRRQVKNGQKSIDIRGLEPGLYILQLQTLGAVISKSVLIYR